MIPFLTPAERARLVASGAMTVAAPPAPPPERVPRVKHRGESKGANLAAFVEIVPLFAPGNKTGGIAALARAAGVSFDVMREAVIRAEGKKRA